MLMTQGHMGHEHVFTRSSRWVCSIAPDSYVPGHGFAVREERGLTVSLSSSAVAATWILPQEHFRGLSPELQSLPILLKTIVPFLKMEDQAQQG